MESTKPQTLEDRRDMLCKEANSAEHLNGVLDMYNEAKKFITENVEWAFKK